MNYSLEKISTVAACDALLVLAQKEKETLERRRRNMGESITNFDERTGDIGIDLISVQSLAPTIYNRLCRPARWQQRQGGYVPGDKTSRSAQGAG